MYQLFRSTTHRLPLFGVFSPGLRRFSSSFSESNSNVSPFSSILIKNIPNTWDEKKVKAQVSEIGEIVSVNLINDSLGQFSGKEAIVSYKSAKEAYKAIDKYEFSLFENNIVKVSPFIGQTERSIRDEENKRKLIIANVHYYTKKEDIEDIFKEFVEVDKIIFPKNSNGLPAGYCFVYLKNEDDIMKAIKFGNGRTVLGRTIYIHKHKPTEKEQKRLEKSEEKKKIGLDQIDSEYIEHKNRKLLFKKLNNEIQNQENRQIISQVNSNQISYENEKEKEKFESFLRICYQACQNSKNSETEYFKFTKKKKDSNQEDDEFNEFLKTHNLDNLHDLYNKMKMFCEENKELLGDIFDRESIEEEEVLESFLLTPDKLKL